MNPDKVIGVGFTATVYEWEEGKVLNRIYFLYRKSALTLDSSFREAFIIGSSQETKKRGRTYEQPNQNQRCIKYV